MTKNSSIPTQSLKIPRIIVLTSKFFAVISPKLVTLFAAKLFTTPIKHKVPKRELTMDKNSAQELFEVPTIKKQVMVYSYGQSAKKILLVHGWSGRGTQLFKIADELIKAGYSTISFDAPAHGKSPGSTTIMVDFIATILALEKRYGPFEAAVGHSLGGMSVLNSIKKGLDIKRAVIIGSGDKVSDIIEDFVSKLGLQPDISDRLRIFFENKYNEKMESYSAYIAAKEIKIPVLVVHDNDDDEVPVKAGIHISQHLLNGELMITNALGHRKILGNSKVIDRTVQFISKSNF